MQDAGQGEGEAAPASGNIIRALTGPQVSVALGIGILLAVLANRIATPNLVDSQARTDILGVIASGGLVTNGVYLLVRMTKKHILSNYSLPAVCNDVTLRSKLFMNIDCRYFD